MRLYSQDCHNRGHTPPPTRLPRGEFGFSPVQTKFSSCGGVPEGGRWSLYLKFETVCNITRSQDHPVLADTPPPEGNLLRDGRDCGAQNKKNCHSCSGPHKSVRFCGWAKAGIGTIQCECQRAKHRISRCTVILVHFY